jgi:hypothetical protein
MAIHVGQGPATFIRPCLRRMNTASKALWSSVQINVPSRALWRQVTAAKAGAEVLEAATRSPAKSDEHRKKIKATIKSRGGKEHVQHMHLRNSSESMISTALTLNGPCIQKHMHASTLACTCGSGAD